MAEQAARVGRVRPRLSWPHEQAGDHVHRRRADDPDERVGRRAGEHATEALAGEPHAERPAERQQQRRLDGARTSSAIPIDISVSGDEGDERRLMGGDEAADPGDRVADRPRLSGRARVDDRAHEVVVEERLQFEGTVGEPEQTEDDLSDARRRGGRARGSGPDPSLAVGARVCRCHLGFLSHKTRVDGRWRRPRAATTAAPGGCLDRLRAPSSPAEMWTRGGEATRLRSYRNGCASPSKGQTTGGPRSFPD